MKADDCRRWRENLGALVLDQLEPDERIATEAHLGGCAECRTERDLLAPVARALPLADPEQLASTPAPPRSLAFRIARGIAAERRAEYEKAGADKIAFAWAGPVTPGEKHYYRVQGPTFVIEFDNTQNNGNHVHSVWRDFDGDFGRDLLREHVKSVAHP